MTRYFPDGTTMPYLPVAPTFALIFIPDETLTSITVPEIGLGVPGAGPPETSILPMTVPPWNAKFSVVVDRAAT